MASEGKARGRGVLAAVFKDRLESDGNLSYRRNGRGRGVLNVRLPTTEPGVLQQKDQGETSVDLDKPVLKCTSNKSKDCPKDDEPVKGSRYMVMCYNYCADENRPGGFNEISAKKGEYLEFLSEHPDNEHWWQAKNEDGEIGYVPSSYVILKEDEVLPWLEQSVLEKREKERKERLDRQSQQQALNKGKGFGPPPFIQGPPPKTATTASDTPYVYVSAYNRNVPQATTATNTTFYCDVCNKSFNGPQPYKAHMASRGHREEVQLRAEEQY